MGFLGYISGAAFNVFMQVPSQFAPANAIDYLTWGVQALVPLVFFWVQGLVLIASFIGLQKLAAWAVQ